MICFGTYFFLCLVFQSLPRISCDGTSLSTRELCVIESIRILSLEYLGRRRFSEHGEYEFEIIHMIPQILTFYPFELFVLIRSHAKCRPIYLVGEYSVFDSLFHAAIFPLIRESVTYSDATLSLIYPVFRISFCFVDASHPFHSEFWILDFLYTLVSDSSEPLLEWLSLW